MVTILLVILGIALVSAFVMAKVLHGVNDDKNGLIFENERIGRRAGVKVWKNGRMQ